MIELKTAVLLAASVKIGAIIGGAKDIDSDLLYDFGINLGFAFQIQDDLLDTYGDLIVFGKKPGGDIISNKKTFLLVKALEIASVIQRKQFNEILSTREFDPVIKVGKVIDLYNDLNIKSITENMANSYINKAFNLLEKIEITDKRKSELTTLANSLIGRAK
jgi:geranylgeranyl diphosphate synthase type II